MYEPLVADGGLDRHLELAERPEIACDQFGGFASESLAVEDFYFSANYRNNAQADSLLVEVNADELHVRFLLWKPEVSKPLVYHGSKDHRFAASPLS